MIVNLGNRTTENVTCGSETQDLDEKCLASRLNISPLILKSLIHFLLSTTFNFLGTEQRVA